MDHQDFVSPQGRQLAYRFSAPTTGLTYVWLSGFKSDMTGTKVTVLEDWAKAQGHGFLAFDYSGHGVSGGAFEEVVLEAGQTVLIPAWIVADCVLRAGPGTVAVVAEVV